MEDKVILDYPDFRVKEGKFAYGENCIFVNTDNFTYTEDIQSLESKAEDIFGYFQSSNKARIIYDILPEGMYFNRLYTIDIVTRYLIKQYNLTQDMFAIINGCVDIPINYEYYAKHCEKLGWLKLEIKFRNSYETGGHIRYNPELHLDLNVKPEIKDKKFLCYNGSSKHHRLFLVAELLDRQLADKGWLSCYYDPIHEEKTAKIEYYYGNSATRIINILDTHKDKFPLDLGLVNNTVENRTGVIVKEDLHHYKTSYFGVVTESKYYHDSDHLDVLRTNASLDGYLISEKTYKMIQGRLPFIIVGFTGSLRALRERGYKTFHPFINESYDLIENDEKRLLTIVDEIERLCSLTDEQWLKLQEHVMPIINHNFELLATR